MMKTRRMKVGMGVVALLGVLALAATTAQAAESRFIGDNSVPVGNMTWINTVAKTPWADLDLDVGGLGDVPVDGNNIKFANNQPSYFGAGNWGLDLAGAVTTATPGVGEYSINLPNSTLNSGYGCGKVTFYDSATVDANNDPLSAMDDFTAKLPSTTLIEAATASTQKLTLKTISLSKDGELRYLVPVKVGTYSNPAVKSTHYGPLTVTSSMKIGRNDKDCMFYPLAGLDASTATVTLEQRAQLFATATTNIDTLVLNDARVTFHAAVTPTIGTFTWNAGTYAVEGVGAFPGIGPLTVTGTLNIVTAQTEAALIPMIHVPAFKIFRGDMTNMVYDSTNPDYNCDLQENALFIPKDASNMPTQGELGGAILYDGIVPGNTTVTVGDDGTSVFKGAAFGAWYGSYRINTATITAAAGSGNLKMVYAGPSCPQVGNNQKLFGDGTGNTTTDISVIDGGKVQMQYGWNRNVDYTLPANATAIRTFNITGEVGKENVNIFGMQENHERLLAEQTYNVKHGRISGTNSLTGGYLLGAFTTENAQFDQPNDKFMDTDTGTLHFGDRTVMPLGQRTGGDWTPATNLDFLEMLDGVADHGTFSYSGTPIIQLAQRTIYGFDYGKSGANPVMAGLLVNADYAVSGYDRTEISSDLLIGHEKYFVWRFNDAQNVRGEHRGVQSTVGDLAKLKPAMNAPDGVTNVMGIAPNDTWLNAGNRIECIVDATGAILRVGSDDPDRIPSFYGGELKGTPHAGILEFRQAVSADKLEIRSGTAWFHTDITAIPTIDIGPGTTLRMQTGTTATPGVTLFGSGGWTGGEGLLIPAGASIAPGDGVGTLTGASALTMEDGATFEWEISDPAGVAGAGWDLLFSTALIDFDIDDDDSSAINFSLIDAGLTTDVTDAQSFIVAARDNGEIDLPGT